MGGRHARLACIRRRNDRLSHSGCVYIESSDGFRQHRCTRGHIGVSDGDATSVGCIVPVRAPIRRDGGLNAAWHCIVIAGATNDHGDG